MIAQSRIELKPAQSIIKLAPVGAAEQPHRFKRDIGGLSIWKSARSPIELQLLLTRMPTK